MDASDKASTLKSAAATVARSNHVESGSCTPFTNKGATPVKGGLETGAASDSVFGADAVAAVGVVVSAVERNGGVREPSGGAAKSGSVAPETAMIADRAAEGFRTPRCGVDEAFGGGGFRALASPPPDVDWGRGAPA